MCPANSSLSSAGRQAVLQANFVSGLKTIFQPAAL
jgi:hypothetical protein